MNTGRFSKAYEPSEFEGEIYQGWEASGAFRPAVFPDKDGEMVNAKGTKETYSIVMPPPNANGNLHIGHGLTIAIEDALTRYHRLKGLATRYVPGADHAGFETWVVYERALEKAGKSRFEFSRDELYDQVYKFVDASRGDMELQLRALGASCNWDDLTFTLDENVVARVYDTFEQMWKDGMIYRGEKLVNFCPHHQTAFADIEVEHKDEKGMLWDIAYPLVEGEGEMIVSTTRPETLFGDAAVAVNPEDERYAGLVGKKVLLPLTNREIPIIADEHADPEYGTGVVKITPAHDFDDFEVGERHNLPRIQVINEDGTMNVNAGAEYAGMTTEECRKKVLKELKEQGLLRGEKKLVHSVGHCYKCGAVLEPMLKEQWFVDVERLAAGAIEHIEKNEIEFFPAAKKKVLVNYLKGLKDWNISRQIPWGIAIPMFRKIPEQTTVADFEDAPDWVFDRRTNLTEIEVGGVKYARDEDTFDTWFSSSHWPIVCTDWTELANNPYYPLAVMETGADILFAWVARMIMMGVYVTGQVPFKEVYLHGLVLDPKGQKMSKSKGNVMNPIEMVARYGSDAFRIGILRGRSAGMNQAFSEESVVAGRNLCNKLWNVARFVQGMVDEDPETKLVEQGGEILPDDMGADGVMGSRDDAEEVYSRDSEMAYTTGNMGEDWICREIDVAREKIEKDMANYRLAEVVETVQDLIINKYADWFLESQKIYKNADLLKVSLEAILKLAHPVMPFVTEAIWQNLSWTDGMLITEKWPSKPVFDAISASSFERLVMVVSEIRSTLAALPGGHRYNVLYGEDSIVEDNSLLISKLAGVPEVVKIENPKGLRLALANHEVYLDVPEKVVAEYRSSLEEKILAVGAELDRLNQRMMNPNYVDKAPAHLVKQTREQIEEKGALIERLKGELNVI